MLKGKMQNEKKEETKVESREVKRPAADRAMKKADAPREPKQPSCFERRPGIFSRTILPALAALLLCCTSRAATVTNNLIDVNLASYDTSVTFTPTNDVMASGIF